MSARDEAYEYRWLVKAERMVDAGAGWVRRVLDRLNLGDDLYGDQWAGRPVDDLIQEIREEAEDIGAWAVLAAQRIRDHDQLDPVTKAQVLDWITHAAACGAQADELLRRALLRLEAVGRAV